MMHRLLANQRAQAVRDGLAVRNQQRPGPPMLVAQPEHLAQNHKDAEQHHAAQQAEHQAEESIHATEHRQPHEVIQRRADHRAQEQDENDNDDTGRPRRDRGAGQQAAQVGLDQVGEMSGEEQRDDPSQHCHELAQKTAHRTNNRRNHDGGNHQIIGNIHPRVR